MSLDTAGLKTGILSLLNDMESRNEDAKTEFASRLGDLIDLFVRSGTVVVEPGIAVSTSGGAGATTAPGTGNIT